MPHFIKKLWQQPDLSRKLLSGAVSCNVNGLILKTNNPNVFYSCTYLNLSFPFLTNKSWPKIMVSLFCTYCTWTTSDGLDDCWVCVVSVVTWLQPFCVFLCCFSVSSYDDLIYWYERWTSCVKTGSTIVFEFCNKENLVSKKHYEIFPTVPCSQIPLRQLDLIYDQLLGTWWWCTVTWKVLLFHFHFFFFHRRFVFL